ncbi:DsbA family protein [Corynebacterium sp. UMB10119B.1]|uniref:DsbA family protein n=1 Tax=Corynebacterium sp. UMB10119B.1 TaxID=3050601 RepID=UPI0025508526|nr:DsbA family protein [Corynebacterium sp. UMB10119B]MDK8364997.1 DsbA family protein [Corynebacterium sp. UMB10119B]
MTTRKVKNPNEKNGAGFIWAIVAVIAIAALVIGLIFVNGKKGREAAMAENMIDTSGITVSWNEDDHFIRLAAEGVDDAPMAELYEDFSCPHCADLAVATDEQMFEKLREGKIEVELRPMVTLDGLTNGHSTMGLAAELALVANDEPAAMMNLRDHLMVNQRDVYSKVTDDDLADLARDYGASDKAVQDIRDKTYYDAARAMSNGNLKLQQERGGEAGTPRVMVDGKDVEGEINNWVDTVANS